MSGLDRPSHQLPWIALAATLLLSIGTFFWMQSRISSLDRQLAESKVEQQASLEPQANPAVISLDRLRGEAEHAFSLPTPARRFLLSVAGPSTGGPFRAELLNGRGESLWQEADIFPSPNGDILIAVHASFFEAGPYRLKLFTTDEKEPVADFRLRVLPTPP